MTFIAIETETIYRGFAAAVTVRGHRELKKVIREAYDKGIRFWQRKFVHRHFDPGAKGKYGYQSRSAKYLASKAKRGKDPNRDLYFTGRSRRMAMNRNTRVTTTFTRGATIFLKLPTRAWSRAATQGRIRKVSVGQMKREVGLATSSEARQVGKFVKAEIIRGFNTIPLMFRKKTKG